LDNTLHGKCIICHPFRYEAPSLRVGERGTEA
jgi:hypothetical protein